MKQPQIYAERRSFLLISFGFSHDRVIKFAMLEFFSAEKVSFSNGFIIFPVVALKPDLKSSLEIL
jgi:hypothetical protein